MLAMFITAVYVHRSSFLSFTVAAIYLWNYSLHKNGTQFFERLLKWLPLSILLRMRTFTCQGLAELHTMKSELGLPVTNTTASY